MSDVTTLLSDWRKGDEAALNQLVPMVDSERRRLARVYLRREKSDHTLQSTALVNEAWIRLMDQKGSADWQSRAHFVGVAARLMRQILDRDQRLVTDQRPGSS